MLWLLLYWDPQLNLIWSASSHEAVSTTLYLRPYRMCRLVFSTMTVLLLRRLCCLTLVWGPPKGTYGSGGNLITARTLAAKMDRVGCALGQMILLYGLLTYQPWEHHHVERYMPREDTGGVLAHRGFVALPPRARFASVPLPQPDRQCGFHSRNDDSSSLVLLFARWNRSKHLTEWWAVYAWEAWGLVMIWPLWPGVRGGLYWVVQPKDVDSKFVQDSALGIRDPVTLAKERRWYHARRLYRRLRETEEFHVRQTQNEVDSDWYFPARPCCPSADW